MSKRHLRQDPVCQNCGHLVEKRFCSQCGQENTESRQSFGHLLRHFVEDITHYDGAFWLTIRFLLFRPAFLTKEFLKGRRASYVPPVRLYIFISFVTFLLPYVLPDFRTAPDEENPQVHIADTILADTSREGDQTVRLGFEEGKPVAVLPSRYKSVREMDSVQKILPEARRLGPIGYWLNTRMIHLQKHDKYYLGERFFESFGHNLPKALFVFMPLFALVLWLFHGKKRWLYFDHAIFTLHYFSFLLLVINLLTLANCFFFIGEDLVADVLITLFLLLVIAVFVYFFVAHRRMYEESRLVSFFKSCAIYIVNLLVFALILLFLSLYSLFSVH